MSRKMLIVQLLLIAIAISWVIPAAVLGETADFRPRNESRWTGSVQIGAGVTVLDGDILVGFSDRPWPSSDYVFRGYAAFDILDLPANACVSAIRLDGYCFMASTASHDLEIRRLTTYPVNMNASSLSDAIIGGLKYNFASSAMRSTGSHSVTLSTTAHSDLESAAQGTGLRWFALGFTEMGETAPVGIWRGRIHGEPVLHVTYSVPVQTAPTLSSDTYQPCAGDEFCVMWNAVSGASSYEVKESDGDWSSVGSSTSICYIKSAAGDYTFSVRAVNSCGIGPASQPASIKVISVPVAPANVWTLNSLQCINSSYTVHWDPVTGADSYEIREDNGSWIDAGNSTRWAFNHSSTGKHNYSVRGVNISCGPGQIGTSSSVKILDRPTTPSAPTTSNPTPCPNQSVTIRWSTVTDAAQYQLYDSIGRVNVYVGPNTSWTAPHPAGSYEYWLKVFNGCGWSNASGPLSVNTKQLLTPPGAPVSDRNPAVVGEPYTISWKAVVGATSYELYELWESGSSVLIYRGSDLEKQTTKGSPGDFIYSVKACGECGCSDKGAELALSVAEPTAVEEIGAPELPGSYALSQNYPNPFNPETRIEFSLKRASQVELTVYDILGETIRTLINDHLSAGYKAVIWDGRDNSGRHVSSGVYLYKLTTVEYTSTKKMMLVK